MAKSVTKSERVKSIFARVAMLAMALFIALLPLLTPSIAHAERFNDENYADALMGSSSSSMKAGENAIRTVDPSLGQADDEAFATSVAGTINGVADFVLGFVIVMVVIRIAGRGCMEVFLTRNSDFTVPKFFLTGKERKKKEDESNWVLPMCIETTVFIMIAFGARVIIGLLISIGAYVSKTINTGL